MLLCFCVSLFKNTRGPYGVIMFLSVLFLFKHHKHVVLQNYLSFGHIHYRSFMSHYAQNTENHCGESCDSKQQRQQEHLVERFVNFSISNADPPFSLIHSLMTPPSGWWDCELTQLTLQFKTIFQNQSHLNI